MALGILEHDVDGDARAAVDTCLEALESAVDAPLWALADAELAASVAETARLRSAVDALLARQAAQAEARNLPTREGVPSTTAWLSHQTGSSRSEAAKVARSARLIGDDVPATRDAWATGLISTEKALVIAASIDRLPDYVGTETQVAEARLLELARDFGVAALKILGNHIIEVIDPEGAEEALGKQLDAEEKRALRDTTLSMRRAGKGQTRGSFQKHQHRQRRPLLLAAPPPADRRRMACPPRRRQHRRSHPARPRRSPTQTDAPRPTQTQARAATLLKKAARTPSNRSAQRDPTSSMM